MRALRWELPDAFEVRIRGKGSFDCVSLRSAQGYFAQDDKLF
jgi:hypothetical protein